MSEPIEPNAAAELETLRRVNAELLQKSATRKARIQELEANVRLSQQRQPKLRLVSRH